MVMKTKAYLLDSDLKIVSVVFISIQPKSGTVTVRDDSFSSLALKIDVTNAIYIRNKYELNDTQYIFDDGKFYKILKITKYKTYSILDVYECHNVQSEELQVTETDSGYDYMLEVK